jgi:hypothetical protein
MPEQSMIRVAEHTWQTAPSEGFDWSVLPEGLPKALLQALEPHSGQQFAGAAATVTEWSMRTVHAAGVHWQILSRIEGKPAMRDGRVNRATRHLILEQPLRDGLPGALLHEDARRPIGGGDQLGHDSMSQEVDRPTEIDWAPCGGDWSEAFANRIHAGDPIRAILPATNCALTWWRAIEATAGPLAWNRNVLLERLPDEGGVDEVIDVVIAVDGTPCAAALRSSGRTVLDLAASPATPPTDTLAAAPLQSSDMPEATVMTTVELKPGGPPVGLAALTILALVLVGGAIAVLVWAMNTGVQS